MPSHDETQLPKKVKMLAVKRAEKKAKTLRVVAGA
jgi:hypothetical protein